MADPELRLVALTICQPCLDGEGSECHTPGCALWMCRLAETVLIRQACETVAERTLIRAGGDVFQVWAVDRAAPRPEDVRCLIGTDDLPEVDDAG